MPVARISLSWSGWLSPPQNRLLAEVCNWLRESRPVAINPVDRWQTADLVYMCGLPTARAGLTPLVAPVLRQRRYGGRPVYYSDVVVRVDDDAQEPWGLDGRRFAFNERNSFSGYIAARRALAAHTGLPGPRLEWIHTGSHLASLAAVREGRADAAAIDSHILDLAGGRQPAPGEDLRVLFSGGPWPAPPISATPRMSANEQREIRQVLAAMHQVPSGKAVLDSWGVERLAEVEPDDYHELVRVAGEVESPP
jgi:phosphonate transport system substrate-binding protein